MAVSTDSCLCYREMISVLGVEVKPQTVMNTNTKSNSRLRVSKHAKKGERTRRGKGTETYPGFPIVWLKQANIHTLITVTYLLAKRKDRVALTH